MSAANDSSQWHGRTDGPTKNLTTYISNAQLVDARAHTGIPTVGDILNDGQLWMTEARHPVLRTGERAEIPSHVRSAVWFRDRGKCELCGTKTRKGHPWHLDHITPWSAGGSDQTTNLRLLCERHNIERSNRIDPTERPRRAATWWCLNCYDMENFRWDYYPNGMPVCGIHRVDYTNPNPWQCRVVRRYRSHWVDTHEVLSWHKVDGVREPSTVAYCAHCDAPGLTDRPL